jgi:hypothetical protein
MKRIALHALLAIALILQGVPAAFGAAILASAKAASASEMSCCPDGMSAQANGDTRPACPDCPDCSCAVDCILVCSACAIAVALPVTYALAAIPKATAPIVVPTSARIARNDSPPIRPPIA